MRAAGLLIFAGALVTGSGSAAQPRPNDVAEVVVRGVAPSNAYAQVLFEVKNKTSKLLERVDVSCGVMNDGKALIGVDEQGVANVSPSEPAYARMLVPIVKPFTPRDAVSATCRIVAAR